MSHAIATFFYIGHFAPGSGQLGQLGSFDLRCRFDLWRGAHWSDHDPSEIVIDEVAGQWIALLPLAIWPLPFDIAAFYYLFGFVAFRLFDITKPGLIGWADRLIGPLGVMLDDVIAGVMAAVAMGLVMVMQ